MAAYEYQALDQRGKMRKGVEQGDTARQIRQTLRERGLHPIEVTAITEATKSALPINRRSISIAELALFLRQLASLVAAGLPLDEALGTLADQSEKASATRIMAALRARVMEGHTLSDGMASFPRAFPPLYRATVAAGEQSGKLEQVLMRLADYAEEREALQRKTALAFVYPIILAVVAVGVVTGLLTYVVPQVIQVFDSLDQTLPLPTRILIGLSDFLRANGWWLLIGIAFVVMAIIAAMRVDWIRFSWHQIKLRLPVIGRFSKASQSAQFTRTLAILTSSSVPLLDGLRLSQGVVTNLPMRRAIADAAAKVREGGELHRALNNSRYFPPLVVRLIAVGESGGTLDEMLDRAASNQERDVDTTLAVIMGILEPALILLVGGAVLFIVLAILLPIFEMNNLIR